MTTVILVRHGQTSWNREDRFRGRADLPLDQFGIRQAAAAGQHIAARWSPSAVYCSPLLRARQTADAIAKACQLSVVPLPGLVDIDYGAWQGLSPIEVQQAYASEYAAWRSAPHTARIPKGETLDEVRGRAFAALREILQEHAGEVVVVLVAHTVVNRLLLCAILGLPTASFWRLRQDTAAINVFEFDGQDFTLVTLNDTSHLDALER